MGCGKSSVGRRVASITSHRFVDTDELVAARAGRSISQIFAEFGEEAFRDMETEVLAGLGNEQQIILATGGGIVLRPVNRDHLRRIGPLVWIDADPEVLFERVSRNRRRPLLQTENPRATFDALLEKRRPIYEAAADIHVDSTGLSHEETARIIIEEVVRFQDRHQGSGFGS